MTRHVQEAAGRTNSHLPRRCKLRARLALCALKPQADISGLAGRYGVSRDEILTWRREMCAGALRWWRRYRRGL